MRRRRWWWGGSTKGGGGGGVPAPLSLPTDWPPLAWQTSTPRRQLAFQPCAGCCGCTEWVDAWLDSENAPRESLGDDWTIESGTWSIVEQWPLVLATCSDSGVITTRRRVSAGAIILNRTMLTAFPTRPDVGQVMRLYFDWADADNCQFAEFIVTTSQATPVGIPYAMWLGPIGTITIKQIVSGAETTLAGPEPWLANADGIFVQFWDTPVADEKYVMAGIATFSEFRVNSWTACRTTFTGAKCGIGGGATSETSIAFATFRQTDCQPAHVDGPCAVGGDGELWEHLFTQGFYARPCGYAMLTGSTISGTWQDIGASAVVLRTLGGILDVTFTLYYREPFDPQYVEAAWSYSNNAECDFANGDETLAVWNFALEEWEHLPFRRLDPVFEGTQFPVVAGSTDSAVLQAAITADNVDALGRVGVRLRLRDSAYVASETDVTVTAVRGGRNEYPLPTEYTVTLGADWPAAVRGVYHVVWDEQAYSDNLFGCWYYATESGVVPGVLVTMRFRETDILTPGNGDPNTAFARVWVFVAYNLGGDVDLLGMETVQGSGQGVENLTCCSTFSGASVVVDSHGTPRTATVSSL